MNWNQNDNKHYRGKIDRIYVSQTEYYEVHHFIDHYLTTRNFHVTEENRRIIGRKMEEYPGQAPVKRDELATWLDGHFKKK